MRLTIHDIARMAGTSATAVSFVLNGKDHKRVRADKRRAILEVVRKHGYKGQTAARALTLRRSYRVAICTAGAMASYPLIGAASHHETILLAAQSLHASGYGLGMLQIDTSLPLADTARRLAQEDVDGFLFVDFTADFLDKILFSLAEKRIPAVSVGTPLDARAPDCSWAAIDREGSFAAGASYLLGQGLRRLAMLDIDLPKTHAAAKRRGYERAMRSRGLDPLPLFATRSRTAAAAIEATQQMISQVPDVEGVLLTDNFYAPLVQHALAGRPVRILGFGDDAYAQLCEPKLSYMRLPVGPMAQACADHILEWIVRPKERRPFQRLFSSDLVLQQT